MNNDIFDEISVFNEINSENEKIISETSELYDSSDEELDSQLIIDIQTALNFPKTDLLISNNFDTILYKRPSKKSPDVRYVWKSARIPKYANIMNIEILLLNWVYTFGSLEIIDKQITKVKWFSKNNSLCESTWRAFLTWILCGCISL
jgi:hypothetical protein